LLDRTRPTGGKRFLPPEPQPDAQEDVETTTMPIIFPLLTPIVANEKSVTATSTDHELDPVGTSTTMLVDGEKQAKQDDETESNTGSTGWLSNWEYFVLPAFAIVSIIVAYILGNGKYSWSPSRSLDDIEKVTERFIQHNRATINSSNVMIVIACIVLVHLINQHHNDLMRNAGLWQLLVAIYDLAHTIAF